MNYCWRINYANIKEKQSYSDKFSTDILTFLLLLISAAFSGLKMDDEADLPDIHLLKDLRTFFNKDTC